MVRHIEPPAEVETAVMLRHPAELSLLLYPNADSRWRGEKIAIRPILQLSIVLKHQEIQLYNLLKSKNVRKNGLLLTRFDVIAFYNVLRIA